MRKFSPKRVSLLVVLVILGALALQYTFFSLAAVGEKMNSINREDDVRLMAVGKGTVDSAYFCLYKEKVWLETRSQIAKTDSISLSIDLQDSTWQIELKGVVLQKSKIINFEADKFFTWLNPGAYHHLFGTQTVTDTVFSTIVKEPITVKKAPRDTTEVDNKLSIADTSKVEPVHLIFKLDNSIILKIEGIQPGSPPMSWDGKRFWIARRMNEIKQSFMQTVRFNNPGYSPEIRMIVPEDDAKAFYRALPMHPLICIKL